MKSFWKKLRNITTGINSIGDITLQGHILQSEYDPILNTPRVIKDRATPFLHNPGYALSETQEYGPDIENVFWLPWLNYRVTYAARAQYEYSKSCNFFITSALTGCRFTVTPDLVLHVAHGAIGSTVFTRTGAEEDITGARHQRTRRLSISHDNPPNDICYGINGIPHRTLVFGVKLFDGVWTYKIFKSFPAPGSWETIL